MKPAKHAIISGGVSMIFAVWAKSWPAVWVCFLSGIFIDLDHYLDYILIKKKIPWRYRELWHFCSAKDKSNMYLIFHSHELLLLLWMCIFYFQLDALWWALAVGVSVHMLADQLVNPVQPFGYFLIYRLKNGFRRDKIFTERYWKEYI